MKTDDVLHCSFQNWYPLFKKVTARSIILPLPDGFVNYLLADGLVLPDSEEHVAKPAERSTSDDSDSEVDWDVEDEAVAEAPKFADFDKKIKEGIKELGGKVFPKLNWSSPRDATWIAMNNSCCCRTVTDIYLLLKSSDFIMHDLTQPFLLCDDCPNQNIQEQLNQVPYFLVLRKWIEVDPSTEFRCFVKDDTLIGISQRDHTTFYDHIGYQRNDIVQDIMSFFREHIQCRFPVTDYVFDVYRKKKDIVYLLDFNPFGEVTDALLFEWREIKCGKLTAGNNCLPEFRYVNHNRGVQPRPYSHYALPRDIVDISTGEDSYKLIDLLNLKINAQCNQDSPSEEENI